MLQIIKWLKKASSRSQIQIKDFKDDVLILPNNEYRIILQTSSINFELKSEAEQDALIDNFQTFLNSLPCSIQILIRVREVSLDMYLKQLAINLEHESEEVFKSQVRSYSEFVQNLVSGNKILTRTFFLIIPHNDATHNQDFISVKENLRLHADIVSKGLEKLGMKVKLLHTPEIVNLFYSLYNGSQTKIQDLKIQTIQEITKNII